MTRPMPFRSRLESLISRMPFEDWWRDAFEERRFPTLFRDTHYPSADIAETENEYLISVELPGVEEKDIEVKLTGDHLTVSGERRQETEQEGKQFHRAECTYGAFERSFELPATVRRDAESVHAKLVNGMLELRVTKVEPQPVTKIPVKAS